MDRFDKSYPEGNQTDREQDGREGFGDDGGTRIGRPDSGESRATSSPKDAIEGSIMENDPATKAHRTRDGGESSGEGATQRRSEQGADDQADGQEAMRGTGGSAAGHDREHRSGYGGGSQPERK